MLRSLASAPNNVQNRIEYSMEQSKIIDTFETYQHSSKIVGLTLTKVMTSPNPLRESWIRGSPDSRTVGLGRYKIEDFVLCPDGTLLGVEGKLGNTDVYISSLVTDLV